MAEPFVAEIRIFAANFAPRGWAFCNGQLLPIAQNTALFSLIGTTYGGDGKSTMALPDLQSRAPMHPGTGPGLSTRTLGEDGGDPTVTLATTEMPAHSHAIEGTSRNGISSDPTDAFFAGTSTNQYSDAPPDVMLSETMIVNNGGSQPHNNLQPLLAVSFIIALTGLFPQRP